MSRAQRQVLVLLALLLVPLLIVGPALVPGRLLLPQHPAAFEPLASEDPERAALARERQNLLASQALFPFVTERLAMREAMQAGVLPTWDPKLGMGLPLAAGSSVNPWYPLNWIELLFGEAGRAWHALLSLVLGGLGMVLFLRARGHSTPAVLYGGLAFQASAFAVVNLHEGMKVDAALALPWCLWSVEGVLAGRSRARPALAVAVAAAMSAGSPAIGIFVLTATALWAFSRWARRTYAPRSGSPARELGFHRARSSILLPLALGVLGSALTLLPMWEASTLSSRAPRSPKEVAAARLPTAAASTLLLPNLFGGPSDDLLAPNNPLAWWLLDEDQRDLAKHSDALEWNLSAGIGTLLLAIAGLVAAPRRALLPGLGLLCVLGFAFAWPGARLVYALPGMNLAAPGHVNAVAWTIWPVLAAVGIDALMLSRRRAPLTILFFASLTGMLGWGLTSTGPAGQLAQKLEADLAQRYEMTLDQVREWIPCERGVRGCLRLQLEGRWLACLSLLGAGAASLAWLMSRRRTGTSLAAWVLLPWCSIAGVEAARMAREHLVPRKVPGALFPHSETIDSIRSATGEGRVLRIDRSASGQAEVELLARPNLLRGYGIADATPAALFPSRFLAEAFSALDPDASHAEGFRRLSDPQVLDHPLLGLAGVTCILSSDRVQQDGWVAVLEREGFHVYRRQEHPAGRGLARLVPFDSSLAPFDPSHSGFDPGPMAAPEDPGEHGRASSTGIVGTHRPSPTRLDALVRSRPEGSWVLFLESWAPGWKASVNGEDAAIEPALGFARAVRVPAGESAIRSWYEPSSLRLGALLSLLAAGVVFFWIRAERRAA